jgi:hypothetical protein
MEMNHNSDLQNLNKTLHSVADLHDNTCAATLQSTLERVSCPRILHLFQVYLDILWHESGHLAIFWMAYIDIVEILLGLVRADRESDWHLHLACIRELIPWCFAMDKTNYSRYLPV